jgi:hypothetical protein
MGGWPGFAPLRSTVVNLQIGGPKLSRLGWTDAEYHTPGGTNA